MYGFHKQRSKDNFHSYGHEFFKKGVLQNKEKLLFQEALKRKPEKKKKISSEIKNVKQEVQKQQKSLSEDQSDMNPSVSIQLEDQNQCLKSLAINMKSQSIYLREQNKREDRRMSKTESLNIKADDQEQNENSSDTPEETKLDRIVIQHNTILQNLHSIIREQLLKCKQITEQFRQILRNQSLGLGQILNNGQPAQCALRLATLLNEQTTSLQKLVALSSNVHNNSE